MSFFERKKYNMNPKKRINDNVIARVNMMLNKLSSKSFSEIFNEEENVEFIIDRVEIDIINDNMDVISKLIENVIRLFLVCFFLDSPRNLNSKYFLLFLK